MAVDTIFGVGTLEMVLRRAGKGYVLGVAGTALFNSWEVWPPVAGTAAAIALALPAQAWVR